MHLQEYEAALACCPGHIDALWREGQALVALGQRKVRAKNCDVRVTGTRCIGGQRKAGWGVDRWREGQALVALGQRKVRA